MRPTTFLRPVFSRSVAPRVRAHMMRAWAWTHILSTGASPADIEAQLRMMGRDQLAERVDSAVRDMISARLRQASQEWVSRIALLEVADLREEEGRGAPHLRGPESAA